MSSTLSFLDSLLVTVVGVSIVFIGLLILIGLIKILVMITEGMGKPKAAKTKKSSEPVAPAEPVAVEAQAATEENDDAIIAVITAAVACMMDGGSAFTVRRVRRISNSPAWQKAGREEQIYSRM